MFCANAFIAENASFQFDSGQAKLDPLLWTQDKFERGLVELYFITLSMILFVLTVFMQFCQNLAETVRNWIQNWSLQVTQRLYAEGDELELVLFQIWHFLAPERCLMNVEVAFLSAAVQTTLAGEGVSCAPG